MIQTALVVEDLQATQEWLVSVLRAGFPGIQVRTAGSVAEASECLQEGDPDIALIDLGLPDGEGVEIIRALNKSSPGTACIVTTIFDDDSHLFTALQAGALGYVLKDQEPELLVHRLQGIIKGQPPLSPTIARRLLEHFRAPSHDASAAISHVATALAPRDDKSARATAAISRGEADGQALSGRETDVLRLIAKGYTTTRTAELLGISTHTASGYIKDIYRKLNIGNRAEAALEATRRGLVYPDAQ